MIAEDKKYISGILRNIGFAFLSPIGALAFQYLVLDKTFTIQKFLFCLVVSAISWFFFKTGYNYVKEKKDVRT